MSSLRLTAQGVQRFRELLDAAMCSRTELVEYLSTLNYELNPELHNGNSAGVFYNDATGDVVKRDATGYIICPPRYAEIASFDVSEEANERLSRVASTQPITPEYPAKDRMAFALDAILRGVLVPTDPGISLHPPRALKHRGSPRPMIHLSRHARACLDRLAFAQPGHTDTPGEHQVQLARILRRLADYEYMWNSPRRPVEEYPRRRYQATVAPEVLEYLAAEGLRLGFPPHKGGRRTPLAVASNVIEAIAQEVLIPAGPRKETN